MAVTTTTAAVIAGGAALGMTGGAVTGVANKRQAVRDADAIHEQAAYKAQERSRQAQELQKRQTVSYFKSGVLLQGTPLQVIRETRDFANQDRRQIFRFADIQSNNLISRANTGIFTSLFSGGLKGGMSGYSLGGTFGGGSPKAPKPKAPKPKNK